MTERQDARYPSGRSTALTGVAREGWRGRIRDVLRARARERSEYPARSRGRWIISRLSRPRAGTEPSIFLFPPIRPLKRRRATRPLRSSPSPSFFSFFFALSRGSAGAKWYLSSPQRERERRRRPTLGWALSILSRIPRNTSCRTRNARAALPRVAVVAVVGRLMELAANGG